MKISFRDQGNYLIVSIEEDLTDTEFIEFKNLIISKVSEDSLDGVIIDLKALDVIDSFTTRILHDIAFLSEEKEVPIILAGIKPVVAEVMERQGLGFSKESVNINDDVPKGISRLNELQFNYR